jgi:hypothetical protein
MKHSSTHGRKRKTQILNSVMLVSISKIYNTLTLSTSTPGKKTYAPTEGSVGSV